MPFECNSKCNSGVCEIQVKKRCHNQSVPQFEVKYQTRLNLKRCHSVGSSNTDFGIKSVEDKKIIKCSTIHKNKRQQPDFSQMNRKSKCIKYQIRRNDIYAICSPTTTIWGFGNSSKNAGWLMLSWIYFKNCESNGEPNPF